MENIRILESKETGVLKLNETAIAAVLEHEDGVATSVCINDEWFLVDDCLHGVAHVVTGDQVIIQNIQGSLIVLQKLRAPNEPKAPSLVYANGQWQLECTHGFKLSVGNAILDVQENGQITIEGRDILTEASGINKLLGSRIELN